MKSLFFRAIAVWIIMVILAIVNGFFRENVLLANIGQNFALVFSGISLSVLIFIAIYLTFPLFNKQDNKTYLLIGLEWVSMTLLFEFIFGHYVIGKSWSEILEVFDIISGNLFIVVLLTSLFSPIIISKIKSS
jgi:hypothetical protein